MATTRLKPGITARCVAGQMQVDWQLAGSTGSLSVLRVRDEQPAVGAVAESSRQSTVHDLPEPARLVVTPSGGQVFPADTQLSGTLSIIVNGQVAQDFRLPDLNVSGTPYAVLATLVPQAGFWEIDVPTDFGGTAAEPPPPPSAPGKAPARRRAAPDTNEQPDLEGTAKLAWYAARRSAQGARAVAPRELQLAVDRSASFLPLVRGRTGQAILDVVIGVNAVCGTEKQVSVWALGSLPAPVRPALSSKNAEGYWTDRLGADAHTGGTLVAPLIRETATDSRDRTVVILTDGAPADLDDVVAEIVAAQAAGTRTRWHVLALATSTSDPRVRQEPWRDELGTLAPLQARGLLTCSAIAPALEEDWFLPLIEDEDSLAGIVSSLPLWGAA